MILTALDDLFYNFWMLPAFYIFTPTLGMHSFRFFIGASSYLANINNLAGLRLLPNQNDVDLVLPI